VVEGLWTLYRFLLVGECSDPELKHKVVGVFPLKIAVSVFRN
jgi:hypothetical protein